MGHNHDAGAFTVEEPFQGVEPVEVEIVRRLIQQVDVKAGKQDPGKQGTGRRKCCRTRTSRQDEAEGRDNETWRSRAT